MFRGDDDVTVFGGSVGLYPAFDTEAMGFVRAGARKVIVDNWVRVANRLAPGVDLWGPRPRPEASS